MANIGNTDTVPARLTPGEVVLNDEQITLLGKITGRNPYELFAAAGVPGSAEQFAGTEGGQVPQEYRGGGVISDSAHESIDNLIMQNDMNDYSPSLLNMVQGYTHGTVSVKPEDMYAGLGYLEPGQDYIPETLPYDPSAQFQMYGTAAGSFEEQMERKQRGKGGLRRGRYESDIAEERRESTSLLGTKVGGARQTQLDRQIASFYKDVREGIISPTTLEEQQAIVEESQLLAQSGTPSGIPGGTQAQAVGAGVPSGGVQPPQNPTHGQSWGVPGAVPPVTVYWNGDTGQWQQTPP